MILIVNGVLRIEEGCADALQKYVKIIVNGSVRYCEELQPYLTNMIVNGTSNVYPSGCVLLNKTEQLDKYFPIKAREGAIYYVEKKIIILDETFDVDKLLEKKVSFTTTKLVIRENLLEKMLPLFPANVELVVIPLGVAYVPEDAVIDDIFIKQFGNKIFIDGNAKIVETAIPYLSQLDYLEVVNEISITNNLLDAFLEYSFQYGSLKVQKGKIVDKKISLTIDNEFLEKNPEGVIVRKSALVKIAPDISNEDILTLLQFEYCASAGI